MNIIEQCDQIVTELKSLTTARQVDVDLTKIDAIKAKSMIVLNGSHINEGVDSLYKSVPYYCIDENLVCTIRLSDSDNMIKLNQDSTLSVIPAEKNNTYIGVMKDYVANNVMSTFIRCWNATKPSNNSYVFIRCFNMFCSKLTESYQRSRTDWMDYIFQNKKDSPYLLDCGYEMGVPLCPKNEIPFLSEGIQKIQFIKFSSVDLDTVRRFLEKYSLFLSEGTGAHNTMVYILKKNGVKSNKLNYKEVRFPQIRKICIPASISVMRKDDENIIKTFNL